MRPLRLELKGFTSFRDQQVVDFSPLELFAIAGPTGAGKSSILDAITYALYGKVERVGNQCAQLISQGLPTMAVSFEFACGADRYRVARRTSHKAPTTVVLERHEDGEWRSDSGRVHDVGGRIERIIGLDYDGFTRAVLLPQGKFDQFLAGDSSVRRRLLTDLLGLGLFERMSKLANLRSRDADTARRTKQEFLLRDYAHVTEEALVDQRRAAADARGREAQLEAARKKVREIVERWDAARRSAEALTILAGEAAALARDATARSQQLRRLGGEAEKAQAVLEERTAAAVAARKLEDRARAEHDKGVAKLGKTADLESARAKAEQLDDLRGHLGEARVRLTEAEKAEPRQQAIAARAGAEAKAAEDSEARAKTNVEAARKALEQLQHDERVAAVAQGLRKGDPCPICGTLLEKLPRAPAAAALKNARDAVRSAEKLLDLARRSSAALLVKAADAANAAKQASNEVKHAREEIAKKEAQAVTLERAVSAVLGAKLPPAPVDVLGERIERLRKLRKDADDARDTRHASETAESAARLLVERISGSISFEAAAIPLAQAKGLLERTARLLRDEALPAVVLDIDVKAEATRLGERTQAMSAGLGLCADELRRFAGERIASGPAMLREAANVTAGLLPPANSLDALANEVDGATKAATSAAVTAETRAQDLADALAQKQVLIGEVGELRQRAERLHAIALDLRQDAIVDFLQAQALRGLAREGGARLRELSDNRYDLRYRRDEFYVADLWNGEEERSVKTLSGGETFLASLALALSLSGQVRTLTSGVRARLDSLFLDEGFGSLDSEAVTLVIAGLERLGSDGRMVGVITHVREITDQLPRIEVHKSPSGSRLSAVP